MLSHLKKYEILLASNSPRRRELLAGLDIDYRVTALPEVDESYPDTLSGEEIPLYISQEKAAAYRRFMKDNTLLITADTIVWLDGKVYGKPRDIADAKAMLQALSGKTHTVITGVTLTSLQKQISFAVSTEVTFAALGDDEIDYYVETYRTQRQLLQRDGIAYTTTVHRIKKILEAVLNLFRDRGSICLGINLKQHPISPVDIIYMEKPRTTTHLKYSTVYRKVRPSETA